MTGKWFLVVVVVAVLAIGVLVASVNAEPGIKTFGGGQTAETVLVVDTDLAKPSRIGIFERRKLGLTVGNLMPLVKEAIESGVDPNDRQALAADVMQRHIAANPAAFKDPQLDWQSILEYIEKLLPLILQIIAIFGGL